MLELEPQSSPRPKTGALASEPNVWKVVAFTSCGWLVVIGLMTAVFMAALERQGQQIELMLQRTAPQSGTIHPPSRSQN
jgi:hypothetical protein